MMGIYIKNIEMPKDCHECPVKMYNTETGETWCLSAEELLADGYRSIQFYKRPEWCSIVEVKEPHGRLIDGDEFVRIWQGAKIYGIIKPLVDARPTVIESEGE